MTPAGGELSAVVRQRLTQAQELGFLGNAPVEAHVAHAHGFADAWAAVAGEAGCPGEEPARWLDLGSGGGLPGLVLAQRWPHVQGVLLDASERRAAFLQASVAACGWTERVLVIRDRAEVAGADPHLRGSFSLVVARSFGSPAVTAECAAPFLGVGGFLIVSEPPGESDGEGGDGTQRHDDERWPAGGLTLVGQQPWRAVRETYGYQVIRQVTPCPERFPRRSGVATKRPLYR